MTPLKLAYRLLSILVACQLLLSCQSIHIVDRPITWNEEREELSLDYLSERYGLEQESPVIIPRMVVVHWTAIPTLERSFAAFKDPVLPSSRERISNAGSLNVSSQYLIDRDGTIYQLLPDTIMARHVIGLNHTAIGIENVGNGSDLPLTRQQLRANTRLIKSLVKKYPIDYVIGHHEYRKFERHPLWLEKDEGYRTEKTDPGDDFMQSLRHRLRALSLKEIPDTAN